MLATLLIFLIVGFVALVAISVILALIGAVFSMALGLAGVLLFKVAPLLLLGWLVLKLVERATSRRRAISAADEKWLDS